MKRSTAIFAAAFLTLAAVGLPNVAPLAAWARQIDNDPLVDTVGNGRGRINYSTGVVKATGYGAPPTRTDNPAQAKLMALGAARADALRNLATAVGAVQVNAETTVKNYVLEKDVVKTKLSALLQAPQVVSETFQRDGTAVVVVELPLYGRGSVASAILPQVLPEETVEPDFRAAEPETRPIDVRPSPRDGFREPKESAIALSPVPRFGGSTSTVRPPRPAAIRYTPLSEDGPFTSVIVDCRGLDLRAVMSPKLYDTSGREVYGTVRVDIDYAIEVGVVGYPRSVDEAFRSKRAGDRPLIVRAIRPNDRFKNDPVISAEDADRILQANRRDGFLEKTRVIFLCDPVR